jgi:4-hydroxy-tetrahydrodipicolinate reductase
MNIGICGICGRMGMEILPLLLEKGHSLAAAFDSESSPHFGKSAGTLIHKDRLDVIIGSLNRGDVAGTEGIMDFSAPSATMKLLDLALSETKPLVIGTTGFSEAELKRIESASKKIPVLLSPNMSEGVNLLFKLTEIAARALQSGFDVEIFEAHHRHKKDAPSGTARRLIDIVKENMRGLSGGIEKNGRHGITGERRDDEIGVLALRGGDIVGEHTVFFCADGQRIELTHRATSRNILAAGAVRAMEFLYGKGAGLYSMFDVLGL